MRWSDRLVPLVLRVLGVPCGDFGGQMSDGRARWCWKRFGHEDSHAWDFGEQPLRCARLRAQGWTTDGEELP